VSDPLYFVRLCPYRRPVIIEPSQVERMLMVADGFAPTPNSPLLPRAMHLAVVILYTAGLRRGGLARLALEDVEPETGVLRIRTSKFHKSRLVPLSPTANETCAPTCGSASPYHSTPTRVQRCCAGGATAVMEVLAWVRPSTACWSPPTCWTPKAVDSR
jgi:integrase